MDLHLGVVETEKSVATTRDHLELLFQLLGGELRKRGLGGALEKAFAGVGKDAAVIYLQHAPGNEVSAAAAGAGLMVDGHTHGAQIWPAHFVVRRIYPHMAGVRKVGDMTQVVSRGAGRWGPPMRLFAPSEIYRITLRNSRGG